MQLLSIFQVRCVFDVSKQPLHKLEPALLHCLINAEFGGFAAINQLHSVQLERDVLVFMVL